mgnify:FL=1|tara:strand:- start:276 stop:518 length:243 start_codon:yes stop_codon:yes gene_type:complete
MTPDNERDFNKVLESVNSLESKIINLEIFIREKLIEVHKMDKENITHQHKVNVDNAKQIGEIIDIITAHNEAIQSIKGSL